MNFSYVRIFDIDTQLLLWDRHSHFFLSYEDSTTYIPYFQEEYAFLNKLHWTMNKEYGYSSDFDKATLRITPNEWDNLRVLSDFYEGVNLLGPALDLRYRLLMAEKRLKIVPPDVIEIRRKELKRTKIPTY